VKLVKAANTIYVAAQIVKALAIVSSPLISFAAEELRRTLNLLGSVHEQKWNETLKPRAAVHKMGKAEPLFRKIEASNKKLDEMLEKLEKTCLKLIRPVKF